MIYMFTLKYRLAQAEQEMDALVERLGNEGCDDALVGLGQPGRLALAFTREAETAQLALVSALADVRRAIPTAELTEATPDFVGLSDAAEVAGVSRQNLRKLMLAHHASFPSPVHEGSAVVWHLADLLDWLERYAGYSLDAATRELARETKQVNLIRQSRDIVPGTRKALRALEAL